VPLLEPARYKGAWGGRGSGKSHFFGELMVESCVQEPGTRAVCIREVQKTLAQSSKRLIEDKIAQLEVGHLFDIQKERIETHGGGMIIFQGMQDHTAESIKSQWQATSGVPVRSPAGRNLQASVSELRTDTSGAQISL
jgi:phage terminase large subunit